MKKMKEYGFEDLGSTISYKEPEKVWDMLTEFVEIVRQHEEEWTKNRMVPKILILFRIISSLLNSFLVLRVLYL